MKSCGYVLPDDGGPNPTGGHVAYIDTAVDAISGLTDATLKAEMKQRLRMTPSVFLDLETGVYRFARLAYTYVQSKGYVLPDDGGPNDGNRQALYGGHRQVEV